MVRNYLYQINPANRILIVLFLIYISGIVFSISVAANPHIESNEISEQFTSSDAVATPIFSHQSGFYSADLNLVLSHPNPLAEIYFTTDGSVPTTKSALYIDPIRLTNRSSEPNTISMIPTNRITEGGRRWLEPAGTIRKGNVIRAVALVNGETSAVETHSIFIFAEGEDAYQLPVISIVTDNENLFDDEIGIYVPGNYFDENDDWSGNYYQRDLKWERPARFEFFDSDGSLGLAQDIGIRIHGGWTRRLPMKSLRLYARSEYGENRFNIKMFEDLDDMSFNRFILRNSGNDFGNSMFMDAAAQSLIRHFNVDTQAYRPVIVFLNGEYWGIHNVRERYDRRYLERVYGADPDNIDLMTGSQTIKEGDSENYEQLVQFIRFSDFSDDVNYQELKKQIDIDNFLDYYSAQIYYGNTDWPQNNIDYWRSKVDYNPNAPAGLDGRWRWLLYDADRSLGFITDASFDMVEWVTIERNPENNLTYPNLFLRSFLRNDTFYQEFINRIADHLNTAFLPDRVSQVIDSLNAPLNPVIEEHIHRWQNHRGRGYWENEVKTMHQYGKDRPGYLRRHIRDHFNVGDETKLTLQVSSAKEGYIRVNSTDILPATPGVSNSPYPWAGIYFSEVPVSLTAVPHDGYEFSHWSAVGELPEYLDAEYTQIRVNLNDVDTLIAHFTEMDESSRKQMIHYWIFTDELPNNVPILFVEPVYSIIDGAYLKYKPAIENYPPYSETAGILDRVNDPIQINYRPAYHSDLSFSDSGMRGIRLRNPSLVEGNRSSVIISTPSTGFTEPEFTFAAKRTENGQQQLRFEYSTDPENKFWSSSGLAKDSAILYEVYKNITLSLSDIEAAENNPNLKIKILFEGDESVLTGSEGNVRFNNISMTGIPGDFLPPENEDDLLTYWIFTEDLPAETPLDTIPAHYSKMEGAFLEYSALKPQSSESELGILDMVDDPTSLNYKNSRFNDIRYKDANITGIRSMNPTKSGETERVLLFNVPTNGYEINRFVFAARRTSKGPKSLIIETNTSGELDEWSRNGLEKSEYSLFETYSMYILNVAGVIDSENNPDFRLRIRFSGEEEYRISRDGNVRFNHFSIHGTRGEFEDPDITDPGAEVVLLQNYPNPFNSITSISYSIPEEMQVELMVYDMLGRRVALFRNEVQQAGTYTIQFDASQLSSGIYMYRLSTGNTVLHRAMTLIK